MQDGGDSFLPRIQSVFYAIFDETIGPKIVYQVPEGLIASGSQQAPQSGGSDYVSSPSPSPDPLSPPTPQRGNASTSDLPSRNSSVSLASPADYFNRRGRSFPSPQKRSLSAQRTLFNFSDISMYVIPPSALCGRLVICSTRRHRIIGFPVELPGGYRRNYFRYNLCFVFERSADLSCYEPIVRKVSRVLKNCEEESNFLSSAQTSHQVHAILEQLYEDLNSYSETSIPIDQFNSIELKIFPFYPNPPEVKDWMVPLCLINLTRRIEDNWDLTMQKVCRYIDGVNHVSRIAQLADCDIRLTRQAISHLLFYQVIMTLDIFQYSNMYTLCKSIQWLADESHVKDECGPYVVKPGTKAIPDWPDLLQLYCHLRTGNTLHEWMELYDVEKYGIDVRRFTTFGVIKGFLRRVHRYPTYIPPQPQYGLETTAYEGPVMARKRARSLNNPAGLRFPAFTSPPTPLTISTMDHFIRQPSQNSSAILSPMESGSTVDQPLTSAASRPSMAAGHRTRRASAAEKVLEQLRSRDVQKSSGGTGSGLHSPRTSWMHFPQHRDDSSLPSASQDRASIHSAVPGTSYATTIGSATTVSAASVATMRPSSPVRNGHHHNTDRTSGGRDSRRTSTVMPPSGPPPSPVMPKVVLTPSRMRGNRSPSTPVTQLLNGQPIPYPPELIPLLDGDHHTDEIGVTLNVGWPQLEEWLVALGGGQGNGDFGEHVVIIYR
ncbi:nitrogen permease regulator Npr2 [Ephemerocybe angulata]|uniref:Nitrogen permease regulator Npr2 n=1 Tax=Ephemerocybe angulata TaxID=980116 RepID=A0A8H6IHH1_9AGAR|nr:nitrogen permease regulator Npr2 [Tulosesus angulatus]